MRHRATIVTQAGANCKGREALAFGAMVSHPLPPSMIKRVPVKVRRVIGHPPPPAALRRARGSVLGGPCRKQTWHVPFCVCLVTHICTILLRIWRCYDTLYAYFVASVQEG